MRKPIWRDRLGPRGKRLVFTIALIATLMPMLYINGLYASFAAPYFYDEAFNLPLYIQFYGPNNAGRFLHLFVGNAVKTFLLIAVQAGCIFMFVRAFRRRRYDTAYGGLILFALSGFITLGVLVRSNMTVYHLFG